MSELELVYAIGVTHEIRNRVSPDVPPGSVRITVETRGGQVTTPKEEKPMPIKVIGTIGNPCQSVTTKRNGGISKCTEAHNHEGLHHDLPSGPIDCPGTELWWNSVDAQVSVLVCAADTISARRKHAEMVLAAQAARPAMRRTPDAKPLGQPVGVDWTTEVKTETDEAWCARQLAEYTGYPAHCVGRDRYSIEVTLDGGVSDLHFVVPLEYVYARDAAWIKMQISMCSVWPRAAKVVAGALCGSRCHVSVGYRQEPVCKLASGHVGFCSDCAGSAWVQPLSQQTGEEIKQTARAVGLDLAEQPFLCNWCQDKSCAHHRGSPCVAYLNALEERVALGNLDCPEERESVKRFVDGRFDLGRELRESAEKLAARKCSCGAPVTTMHGSCSYCAHRALEATRLGPSFDPRANVDGHPKNVRASKRLAAIEKREARPNASQRELSKGHPVSWPSIEGDEP